MGTARFVATKCGPPNSDAVVMLLARRLYSRMAPRGLPHLAQDALRAKQQSLVGARLEPALRAALQIAGLSLVEQSRADHVRMLAASTRTELQAFLRALELPHLVDADWAQLAAGPADPPDVPSCPTHDHFVTEHAHTRPHTAESLLFVATLAHACVAQSDHHQRYVCFPTDHQH
jgi:hypothetical protein